MGKIHVYPQVFEQSMFLYPFNLALHRQWQRALQALKIWPGTVQVTGRLTALPLSSQRLLGSEKVATNSANSIRCQKKNFLMSSCTVSISGEKPDELAEVLAEIVLVVEVAVYGGKNVVVAMVGVVVGVAVVTSVGARSFKSV